MKLSLFFKIGFCCLLNFALQGQEICNNGIDDNANGLIDCADPLCAANTTVTNTGPFCVGRTIQLNATGGGTYSWAGPGGFTSTLANPTRAGATTAMAGTYTVTVTRATGCIRVGVTTVVVNTAPIPVVLSNSPVCLGQAIDLSASGGSSYLWSGPGGFSSTAQNPIRANATSAMSGTYMVTATNSNGCTATVSLSVNVVTCTEVCTDVIDNDGDGAMDCADTDCSGFPYPTANSFATGQGPINGVDPNWDVSGVLYAGPVEQTAATLPSPNASGVTYTDALISQNCAPGAWVNASSLPPPLNSSNWITSAIPCVNETPKEWETNNCSLLRVKIAP